jgi:hypothetical protein
MTIHITKQMLKDAKMPDTPTARSILAKMLDDDDIQDYVRPWVGLTDEDIALIDWESLVTKKDCVQAIEAKLKEKNT